MRGRVESNDDDADDDYDDDDVNNDDDDDNINNDDDDDKFNFMDSLYMRVLFDLERVS